MLNIRNSYNFRAKVMALNLNVYKLVLLKTKILVRASNANVLLNFSHQSSKEELVVPEAEKMKFHRLYCV